MSERPRSVAVRRVIPAGVHIPWLCCAAMAHPNEELIDRFYAAFGARDGAAMSALYAPNARFSDPVFTDLSGDEPGAMWRMLTGRATDLRIELAERSADDQTGSAHWLADYTFAQTGRPVHNDIRASFRFVDGRIAEHRDSFDFYKWSRQAFGTSGLLLGWTPLLRSAVRRRSRKALDEFMTSEGGPA
jgi:ketosteroid isomerase-like protein